MRESQAKRKLASGDVVVGVTVSFLHPGLAEFLGLLGFDCLIVDGEHGSISDGLIEGVARAGDLTGATAVVRLPFDVSFLQRYLDIGVSGVQIPRVRSAGEAADIVAAVKFAPVGRRGLTLGRTTRYGLYEGGIEAFVEASNNETLVMIQIEDREGIEALPSILEIDGIDVVLVGPLDLSDSLGVTGQMKHPLLVEAVDGIIRQTVEAGKVAGLPVGDPASVPDALRRGARFILTSATSHLASSARDFLSAARSESAVRR